jgi:REP element-mobilizing transposase RayT
MILNDTGNIAQQCWLDIPQHFPNVELHEYVVMPNHIHGIVELTETVVVDECRDEYEGEKFFAPTTQRPRGAS